MQTSRLAGAVAVACALGAATPAWAFTTRIHIMLSNELREGLEAGGGNGRLPLLLSEFAAQLSEDDARAIVENPLAFRAGAVGPDNIVFPASLTDPSHGVHYHPWVQCELLYQD